MAKSQPVFPENRHALYEAHEYSPAIRSGGLLFVSGQVGSREDGTPEPTYAAQVSRAFANLKSVLAAAGCTTDDIIDVTGFHTDPEAQFAEFMIKKQRFFPKLPYPNWTAIGVNRLARFDFEIKVVARIPSWGTGSRAQGFSARLRGIRQVLVRKSTAC